MKSDGCHSVTILKVAHRFWRTEWTSVFLSSERSCSDENTFVFTLSLKSGCVLLSVNNVGSSDH